MDVTDHEGAEEALRVSEERFRTLLQFSFDVYWETDAQHRFTRQEFSEDLADAPARGSEIGKPRWEVPYLEPDEEAWREHRATLEAHLPFRDLELARPTPDGGKRYVRWPTKRRRPWTGGWTFTAPWSRSLRGSIHRGRIDRCCRMPSL